ncbi:MAG: polyribonucleotide nucleotidyltransferase [Phycisphaerales bacterium]|nr:MAG: polyribonucleotide nucleotidyltransferase [Phycisphaerales bacterium]
MDEVIVEKTIAGRTLTMKSRGVAKQADGAVWAQYGDTVVLATVVRDKPREGIDFFPLTVDYREKTSAAGKFPGGFIKREGRPTTKEILTMRMIDRPARPLFAQGFRDEVQIQVLVLSADQENDPDVLAMNGATAALALSSIPFGGPTASVRVGRVDGKLVINPTIPEMEYSDLDLLLSGRPDGICMIEVGAHELPEEVVSEAIRRGHETIKEICGLIEQFAARCGKEKLWEPPEEPVELKARLRERALEEFRRRRLIAGKLERQEAIEQLYEEVIEEFAPADAEEPENDAVLTQTCLHELEEEVVRDLILNEQKRADGRRLDEVRPLSCEVRVLPRTHGSAIFTRGETQALVTTTLGTVRDEQIVDGLMQEYSKKFMLHYNFPPFCVGEARRIMGPGRREIGHGALAERSLEPVLPSPETFPYTIRVMSDILESNGSSSMATVCGGTLALMDAGVPIQRPVAGISIGMVKDGDREVLLTDIIGEEDHFGDMDFKVAGTQRGITGVQLDLKVQCISHETIANALGRAKEARMHILKAMLQTLPRPRKEISDYAPRILSTQIAPDKIGKLIGPGGKGIRKIETDTGARVEIEDDGTVVISCLKMEGAQAALAMVEAITEEVKVGKIYTGRVASIKDFGAFVEIAPGQDGLCHISELDEGYVKNPSDVCKVGDEMRVKVILIDDQGRVKLSRKAALKEEGASRRSS